MRRNHYVLANRRPSSRVDSSGGHDRGEEGGRLKKALDAILVMVALAAFGTVLTFLAKESTTGALMLTWAPVAIGGTYAIGKAKGRGN